MPLFYLLDLNLSYLPIIVNACWLKMKVLNKPFGGLGGLVVYSSDSHGDGTGSILAAAFGYTLVTTDLYGG